MKEATNSAGRKISLLNDHESPVPTLTRLPSFTPSLRSRTSSYATSTSSIGSPPTPQLVRSNSSDSMDMTPSPITPDFSANDHEQFSHPGFFAGQHHQSQQPKEMDSNGFQMLPFRQAQPQPQSVYYAQQALPQHPGVAPPPVAAAATARPRKNQYPCPLAKQENCNDFFTTSGHAARHSKKHTGRKDAICPECNKAFTRKDNMEQHRRTHKGGRSGAKTAGDRSVKKAKTRESQRPRLSPVQSMSPGLSATPMVDPSLSASPTGSYLSQPAQSPSVYMHQSVPGSQFMDYEQRNYPDPTAFAMTYHPFGNPPPPSNDHDGLNALATAASDSRMFTQ